MKKLPSCSRLKLSMPSARWWYIQFQNHRWQRLGVLCVDQIVDNHDILNLKMVYWDLFRVDRWEPLWAFYRNLAISNRLFCSPIWSQGNGPQGAYESRCRTHEDWLTWRKMHNPFSSFETLQTESLNGSEFKSNGIETTTYKKNTNSKIIVPNGMQM